MDSVDMYENRMKQPMRASMTPLHQEICGSIVHENSDFACPKSTQSSYNIRTYCNDLGSTPLQSKRFPNAWQAP